MRGITDFTAPRFYDDTTLVDVRKFQRISFFLQHHKSFTYEASSWRRWYCSRVDFTFPILIFSTGSHDYRCDFASHTDHLFVTPIRTDIHILFNLMMVDFGNLFALFPNVNGKVKPVWVNDCPSIDCVVSLPSRDQCARCQTFGSTKRLGQHDPISPWPRSNPADILFTVSVSTGLQRESPSCW